MTPLVRATEQAPVAAPRTTPRPVSVNLLQTAKPVIDLKASTPNQAEDRSTGMLNKRRRRQARMSNRH